MCAQRSCCMSPDQADRFVRNTVYTGSLTQRNPVAKPKTRAMSAVRSRSVVAVKSSAPIIYRLEKEKRKKSLNNLTMLNEQPDFTTFYYSRFQQRLLQPSKASQLMP